MTKIRTDRAPPRAPRHRIEVSGYELFLLIETLEARAGRAADNPETVGIAADWFNRAAELRDAAR